MTHKTQLRYHWSIWDRLIICNVWKSLLIICIPKKVLPSPWHWLVFQSADYTVLFGYRGVFLWGGVGWCDCLSNWGLLLTKIDYIWPMWIITGFCSYKGVYYTQGQTWSDGCDRNCRCEEPSKGLITCTNKWVFYGVWLKIMSNIHDSSSKFIKNMKRRIWWRSMVDLFNSYDNWHLNSFR